MTSTTTRLLHELRPGFAKNGFAYNSKKGGFTRAQSFGFERLSWSSWPTVFENGDIGQQHSIALSVRHSIVENSVNQLGLIYGVENQMATTTVSCSLDTFRPSAFGDVSIRLRTNASDDEIAQGAKVIHRILEFHGLPFFEKYSSLLQCAVDLNEDKNQRSHFLANNFERRMYSAIASAFHSGEPQFDELPGQWLHHAQEILPSATLERAKSRVAQLISILKSVSSDALPIDTASGSNHSMHQTVPLRGTAGDFES